MNDFGTEGFRCADCGKKSFRSRKAARQMARRWELRKLHVYRCPHGNGLHVGHIPTAVARGQMSAQEYEAGIVHHSGACSVAVRQRFAECCPSDVLAAIGREMAHRIVSLTGPDGGGPTWREALERYRRDPNHPISLLFAPPKGSDRTVWREQACRLLMETLREEGWISFNRTRGSLRAAQR